jgi:hypothetical protein
MLLERLASVMPPLLPLTGLPPRRGRARSGLTPLSCDGYAAVVCWTAAVVVVVVVVKMDILDASVDFVGISVSACLPVCWCCYRSCACLPMSPHARLSYTFDSHLTPVVDIFTGALQTSVSLPSATGNRRRSILTMHSLQDSAENLIDSHQLDNSETIGDRVWTWAYTLKETAGGVADFIHRSAVAVATEIARLEDSEQANLPSGLDLPWMVPHSTVQVSEDVDLKNKILALSLDQSSFLQPYTMDNCNANEFVLDEPRIHLIRRLLELDSCLAVTHARLSGRSDVRESVFWRNYFYNCEAVRQAHLNGADGRDGVDDTGSEQPVVVITSSLEGSSSLDDDESFVNVTGIPSPPTSLGLKSIDSCILVDDLDAMGDADNE